jgi:hypothetical protein
LVLNVELALHDAKHDSKFRNVVHTVVKKLQIQYTQHPKICSV